VLIEDLESSAGSRKGEAMTIRLTWVERDVRGNEIASREELTHSESAKTPTRNQVAKLVARFHPELASAARVHLLDSSESGRKWYIKSTQLSSNRWVTVYADPLS